jgi:hypothetical protein
MLIEKGFTSTRPEEGEEEVFSGGIALILSIIIIFMFFCPIKTKKEKLKTIKSRENKKINKKYYGGCNSAVIIYVKNYGPHHDPPIHLYSMEYTPYILSIYDDVKTTNLARPKKEIPQQ